MRFSKLAAGLALASMVFAGAVLAADRGTPDEAKALVEKAAAHLTAIGAEKAFADFNNPTGAYVDRDLFVFVYSLDGVIVSAGANTALLGKNAAILKDVDGKEFGKMIMAAAHGGGGWSDYRMANPVTKKAEPKTTYAVKAGDYIVAAGAYKP